MIPDDKVEEACAAFYEDENWRKISGDESINQSLLECMRAALQIAVEWERQNCNDIIRKCWGEESEIYAKFRARAQSIGETENGVE